MIVNGINRMACRTLRPSLSPNIRLMPMPQMCTTGNAVSIVVTNDGVFGCFETMMCKDNCPLDLPINQHMEHVRGRVAEALKT